MFVERLFIVCSRPQILGMWTYVVRSCQIWTDWLVCLVKVFCVLERLRFSGQLCWVHNFFNRISSLPLLVLRNGHRSWSSLALKKTRFWNLYSNQMTCLDRSVFQSSVFMFKGFWGHVPWKLECGIVMNSPNILTEMDNQTLSLYRMHTGVFHIFSISLNAWWWPFELSSAIKPMVQQSKIGGQNSPRLHLDNFWHVCIFRTLNRGKTKKNPSRWVFQESFTDIKWQTLQLNGQWPNRQQTQRPMHGRNDLGNCYHRKVTFKLVGAICEVTELNLEASWLLAFLQRAVSNRLLWQPKRWIQMMMT